MLPDIEVDIIAITFPSDGLVQIQYAEKRDVSRVAALQRSIMVDTEYLEDELPDLLDAARAVVDRGLLLMRNPPKLRGKVEDEG